MPYWIQSTLLATPALIGLFLGVGLPWTLLILPRHDWRDRVMLGCLTLALGPMLITAWMFILGSIPGAALLRLDTIIAGMVCMAAVGWALVWRKRLTPPGDESETCLALRFRTDEKLLIALIAIALVIRWLGVAYWPSTAYDAQWVYAYEGKLYALLGYIPQKIAYYPQFLPLLHTYLQIVVGAVNDHAARAILPFLHLGSILAVYVLGNRLFNRRVGIYAMAIWVLYPHVGEWSRYGDLEIPLTFMFTAAVAFFVMAWAQASVLLRRRYAFIAGLLLGTGMWTKPTMGAFIWGIMLVLVVYAAMKWWQMHRISISDSIRAMRPQLEIVLIAGLASIPLGAVWYVRNLALGYNPIDFPSPYWQTLAARSGVELGWPLLALLLFSAWVWWSSRGSEIVSLNVRRLIMGLLLVLLGVLPSIINSGRVGVNEDRMGVLEWLALAAGLAVLTVTFWRWASGRWTQAGRTTAARLGWLLLLALPYFVTWFYSYSYHYRLSFAIVPLMIMPTAVILAHWTEKLNDTGAQFAAVRPRRAWSSVYIVTVLLLAVPGIIAPLYDPNAGWDWLWTDKLPDDHARYASGNTALMSVVDGLQTYLDQNNAPLHVVAPGIKRLPFFFPLEDIRLDTLPTRLEQLEGITYFIYGRPESGDDFNKLIPGNNQVISALSLATTNPDDTSAIMRRAWGDDDGLFKYIVYELHLENRFTRPSVNVPPPEGDVVFGDFVRFLGHDIGGSSFWQKRRLTLHLYWQVLTPPTADFMVYIHLRDKDGNVQATWDGPVTRTNDGNYYTTLVWQPGEFITDERQLTFDNPTAPLTDGYQIIIGLYDLATGQRVPVTINGQPSSDGYTLSEHINVQAPPAK